jgi:hypothetical protein
MFPDFFVSEKSRRTGRRLQWSIMPCYCLSGRTYSSLSCFNRSWPRLVVMCNMTALWDVPPCGVVKTDRSFRGTYRPLSPGRSSDTSEDSRCYSAAVKTWSHTQNVLVTCWFNDVKICRTVCGHYIRATGRRRQGISVFLNGANARRKWVVYWMQFDRQTQRIGSTSARSTKWHNAAYTKNGWREGNYECCEAMLTEDLACQWEGV